MEERMPNEYKVVIPTAPGANPSSFPDFKAAVEIETEGAPQKREEQIELPDGSRIAPNGAVIEDPMNTVPEIEPPNKYTPEKEDLDLLIL